MVIGTEQIPTIGDWMPATLIIAAVGIAISAFGVYWLKRGWWKFVEHKPRIRKN